IIHFLFISPSPTYISTLSLHDALPIYLDASRIVDVIEVKDREESRVGTPPPQVIPQVDAVQPLAQHLRRQTAHPLVEVAEHELGAGDVPIAHHRRETKRLMPPLEDRGAEMHVVQVQRAAVDDDVDALHAPRLARLPREIVLG